MSNIIEQAIDTDDRDQAAKIIKDALGIQSDDVVNYGFPKSWPDDREQRASIIGEWLQTEARFSAGAGMLAYAIPLRESDLSSMIDEAAQHRTKAEACRGSPI